jgi:hypothetical protein
MRSIKRIVSVALSLALLFNASGYSLAQTTMPRPAAFGSRVYLKEVPQIRLQDETPLKTKVDTVKKYVNRIDSYVLNLFHGNSKMIPNETEYFDGVDVCVRAIKISKENADLIALKENAHQDKAGWDALGMILMIVGSLPYMVLQQLIKGCGSYTISWAPATLKTLKMVRNAGLGVFAAGLTMFLIFIEPVEMGKGDSIQKQDPCRDMKGIDSALCNLPSGIRDIEKRSSEELYESAKNNRMYEFYINDL